MSNIRTTGKKTSNTLVRDLVNVGIFAALYIVLAFISSSIGYIPALIVFSTGSIALVTSIPLFLFFSKIERSILCCLIFCGFFGTAMFIMGQGVLMLTISLLVGLLAGVVLKVLGRGFAGLFSANLPKNTWNIRAPCAMLVTWRNWQNLLKARGHWLQFMLSASWAQSLVDL